MIKFKIKIAQIFNQVEVLFESGNDVMLPDLEFDFYESIELPLWIKPENVILDIQKKNILLKELKESDSNLSIEDINEKINIVNQCKNNCLDIKEEITIVNNHVNRLIEENNDIQCKTYLKAKLLFGLQATENEINQNEQAAGIEHFDYINVSTDIQ